MNSIHNPEFKIQNSDAKGREWRLIPSACVPTPGQMAYDGELFKRFKPGEPPILRFFFFQRPTLTLGRLEARRIALDSLPFPHEVRPTGGRAVLHGEGDLCYSIVAATADPLVGGELLESYRKISALLAYALRGLGREVRLSGEKHAGIEAGHCFASPSFAELTLQEKKVAGGAQAREGGVFLQQGVILLTVDKGWDGLFPGQASAAMAGHEVNPGAYFMAGLNGDASLPPLGRADVERAVTAAFEEAGAVFERHFAPV